MAPPSMSVRFWGVRGSVPCAQANMARYGGHTSCVEVRCGEHLIVLDAGSGLHLLGAELETRGGELDADFLFTHCHIDHLIGLPFFMPLYARGNSFRMRCGHMRAHGGLKNAIEKLMSFPLFPVGLAMAKASLSFHDFEAGERFQLRDGITVRTVPLEHPGGATGYRIEHGDSAVVHLTDLALHDPIDPQIIEIARDASLLIIDATYTDAELPAHQGWGHSSWQQAVRLAKQAGAKKLCLFHHDPDHDDAFMDRIAADAAAALPGTVVAQEGLVIEV